MRLRIILGRALLGIVALVLAVSGVDHFVSYGALSEYYASLGWPPSLTEVIGATELVVATLLVIPRVQRLAAVVVAIALSALLGRQLMRGQETLFFAEPAFWMFVACVVGAVLVQRGSDSFDPPKESDPL